MANTEQVVTRVSPEAVEALKLLAAEQERSIAYVIRSILYADQNVRHYLETRHRA